MLRLGIAGRGMKPKPGECYVVFDERKKRKGSGRTEKAAWWNAYKNAGGPRRIIEAWVGEHAAKGWTCGITTIQKMRGAE